MSSFIKFLTQDDPGGNKCSICGRNRYTCACDDTPAVDAPQLVTLFHPITHKRMPVERYTDKYVVMCANGWIELEQ